MAIANHLLGRVEYGYTNLGTGRLCERSKRHVRARRHGDDQQHSAPASRRNAAVVTESFTHLHAISWAFFVNSSKITRRAKNW
jgi:hypothetical protein